MIKKIFSEFKNFAIKGNAIDMAIGIIIGTAFGKIVDSLVRDIIMPPICVLLGKIDLDNFFLVLKKSGVPQSYDTLISAKEAGAVTINYGNFISCIVNFLTISICVFLLVKIINVKKSNTKCQYCRSLISSQATRCPYCTSMVPSSQD